MSTKYSPVSLRKKWSKRGTDFLKGKTVKAVRYLTDNEMQNLMWYKNAPVIIFTDGTQVLAQSDDEGNDGGTLLVCSDEQHVLPSIY